jgi:predicted dehydrogenase
MIRAGVIGVGSLGQHHARVFASLPGVRLAGVSDLDAARGALIAERHAAPFFKDFNELVDQVDCVSVATPTTDHLTTCRPFLEAGRHVLVEKPIAATPDEGREMIRLAEASGALLQVGHLERFNPAFLAARPLIDRPRFFEIHRLGVFVPRSLDVNVVLDLMIHDLDMVLHLTGSTIREVQAAGIPVLTGKIDIANVRLRFDNGAVANLTASRVSTEKTRKLRFFQPNAYFSIDLGKQTANTYSLQPADNPLGKEIIHRTLPIEPGEPLQNELSAFIRSIREQAGHGCSGAEGLAALEAAHRILREMETV